MNTEKEQEGLDLATSKINTIELTSTKFLRWLKHLPKRWFIDAFTGMAQGLFVTLIAGLIIKQIGTLIGDNAIGKALVLAGNIASLLTGAGIGAGIASHLKASRLVIFGSMVAGFIGAFSTEFLSGNFLSVGVAMSKGIFKPGNPISAYICALMATEFGMLISGKTKLDILLVPLVTIVAGLVGMYVAWPFVWLINVVSKGIDAATAIAPFSMGVIISVVVGILLTMPTSSAAICIALGLGGIPG
ncbi:MAG: PTS sugar transporter subunit IIC, partial [Clostridia bacterium]